MTTLPPIEYDFLGKVVICGDEQVGKTSLIRRLRALAGEPDDEVGVISSLRCAVGPVRLLLSLVEAQQLHHRAAETAIYRDIDAAFFVCDATRPSSFSHIGTWEKEVFYACRSHALFTKLLVATKCDLAQSRAVSSAELHDFAATSAMRCFELSSLPDCPEALAAQMRACLAYLAEQVLLQKRASSAAISDQTSDQPFASIPQPSSSKPSSCCVLI